MDDTSSFRGFYCCTISIFEHDRTDICHGWLSLYGWMDYSNQSFRAVQLQLDKPTSTARFVFLFRSKDGGLESAAQRRSVWKR